MIQQDLPYVIDLKWASQIAARCRSGCGNLNDLGCAWLDEVDFADVGDETSLDTLLDELVDGLVTRTTAIESPLVDVHLNKAIRQIMM